MAQTNKLQAQLPRFDADGVSHALDCLCPHCQGWLDHEAERRAAEAALARRREKRRVKSLALTLELEEEERRTAAYLADQSRLFERYKRDDRLDQLLAARNAGKAVKEAIAEVESRFARPALRTGSSRR